MLAALLRQALARRGVADEHEILSAGIAAGDGGTPSVHAVSCMQQRGLDISGHRSRNVQSLDLGQIDAFLCMGPQHGQALVELGAPSERIIVVQGEAGGVPDPFGGGLEDYAICASSLEQAADAIAGMMTRSRQEAEHDHG